jgi:hypothetical protein
MTVRAFVPAAVLGLLALSSRPATAQNMGTLTHNGTVMSVQAAVAIFDPKKPELKIHLLPFVPTPGEISLLQKGETMWMFEKKTLDAKKWPTWVPRAALSLSWGFEPASVGNLDKSWYHLYAFGIGKENSNLNFNAPSDQLKGALSGKLKVGEQVTLKARGEDSLSDDKLAWDLAVTTKVLPALARE